MRLFVFLCIFVLLSIPAFGKTKKAEDLSSEQERSTVEKKTKKVQKTSHLKVKVKGMVCAFCAQGIEKNFNDRDEVEATKVDLDTMTVKITLKKNKSLEEKVIRQMIVDAGFAYGGILEE